MAQMLYAGGVSQIPIAGSKRSTRGLGLASTQQCPIQSLESLAERSAKASASWKAPLVVPLVRALQEAPSKWSTAPRVVPTGKSFPVVNQTPRESTTARCVPFTSGPSERCGSQDVLAAMKRAAPTEVPAQSAPSGPGASDATRGPGSPVETEAQPEAGA